jgi:hypothetical protein
MTNRDQQWRKHHANRKKRRALVLIRSREMKTASAVALM